MIINNTSCKKINLKVNLLITKFKVKSIIIKMPVIKVDLVKELHKWVKILSKTSWNLLLLLVKWT